MSRQTSIVLFGGIAALMVATGIGRFAFTPILPMMMEDHQFCSRCGLSGTSNYLGI